MEGDSWPVDFVSEIRKPGGALEPDKIETISISKRLVECGVGLPLSWSVNCDYIKIIVYVIVFSIYLLYIFLVLL